MRIKKRILAGAMALACALSSLSLTALADEVNAVAQPTLHYDFTKGDAALQNIGTAEAADAALINGATLTDNGVDLAGSGRQAVELTGATMKNAVNGSTKMTLSMMIKADQDGGNRTLISYGRGEAHRLVVVTNFGSSTHPRWSSGYRKDTNTDALAEVNFESQNGEEYGKVLKNKWTNVTFVQDGKNLALYVNGDLIREVSDFRDTLYDLTAVGDAESFSAYIGSPKSNIYKDDAQFDGTLSDFRIYDQALSADEVGAVYDETLANVSYGSLKNDKIEAENFSYWNRSEVSEGAPKTEGGDSYKSVANTKNGLTLTYKGVNFRGGSKTVTAHVKGGLDKVRPDTEVKLYVDSAEDDNLVATLKPYEMFTANGWTWVDVSAATVKEVSGVHDLIVVMSGTADGGGSYMGNYDYFEFSVDMQQGLNASYYQALKDVVRANSGWVYGEIVKQATGYGDDYNNAPAGDAADKNKLFDASIQAMLDASKVTYQDKVTTFQAPQAGNDDAWRAFTEAKGSTFNDTLVHYVGKMTVKEAGSYTFDGKIDNGAVIMIDNTRVFEFWGNRSWADGGYINGSSIDLTAGEHDIEVYYIKYGGGQTSDIRASKDGGDKVNIDNLFTFDLDATIYNVYGQTGDIDAINNAIGAGRGWDDAANQNDGILEGNQNYDASIDAVMQKVTYIGTQVIPSVTIGSNSQFRNYAAAVGCNTNNDTEAVVINYSGYITPLVTGDYKFSFDKIDNGLVMEIAGQRVAEFWAAKTWYDSGKSGFVYDDKIEAIHLEAGVSYPFKATYLEINGGEASLIRAKTTDGTVNDARLDDMFVFTTAPYFSDEFDKGIPTLDAAPVNSEVVADLDFTKGVPTTDDALINAVDKVTYDAVEGAAEFAGGNGDNSSMIELASSVTDKIKDSQTLVIETVVKAYDSPGHGYIASVGTEGGKIALAGLRSDWRLKTASCESSYNAIPYAQWVKVKWVFSKAGGTQIYANDKLVGENKGELQDLSAIEGNLRIGRYTNSAWKDDGLRGKMTQFRVSVFNQPALGAADEDARVLSYVNFANDLPEGVVNQGVETQYGIGKFTGGKSTAIVFPESMTDEIKKAETVITEFVVKANAVNNHRILASLGTTNQGHAHMIMGTRQEGNIVNALKTANNAASNDSIVPGEWTKVRYEISRNHTKVYANDQLVLDADEITNFAMLSGSMKFGQYTVSQWPDDGLNGYASEIRVSVKGEYQQQQPESGLVDEKTVNENWPTGNGDYYYGDNFKFTNVVPGIYKIAYTISGVNVKSDDWQMRISPKVRSCGGFERRCWVDFRYVSKVGASVTENNLGDKIMVVAVITVPEGYDEISPGAFIEAGANAGIGEKIDSIRLYTGDYDLRNVEDYEWAVEVSNLSTPGEDNGGLLRAFNGTWKPSTRGELNANNNISEVKVDGVEATIDGDAVTVSVPRADSHNVDVTMEDKYAYYAVADDQKSITVWSSNDTEGSYTLEITELAEYAKPDENGIIQKFDAANFANGHTWDGGVAVTTDDNGNLVMPKGNAGNFWGAYWNEVRPNNHYFLDEGTYKVVYLFDVAQDADYCEMLLKVFQKNGDAEWRINENGLTEDLWKEYCLGKKIAISFPITTTRYLDGFEIGGWKASGFSGTMDGIYILSADTDVSKVFPDYGVVAEESPRYFNNSVTKAAEAGSYTPSTLIWKGSSDATLASVTVDGVAAKIDGDNITVEVAKADTHNVVITTTDVNAKAVYDSATGKITVTAEDGTVKEYTLTITEAEYEVVKVEAESVAPEYSGSTLKAVDSSTYNTVWGCGDEGTELKVEDGTSNGGTGGQIAGTKNGDWFKYTVDCGDGLRKIDVRYTGNTNSADVKLLVKLGDKDGETIAEINCPATGSWSSWTTASTSDISKSLTGEQTLCFVVERTGEQKTWNGNYDYFEFTTVKGAEPQKSSDATLKSVTVGGVAATIAGDKVTVALDKSETGYEINYTAAAGATVDFNQDTKTFTVTAEDGVTVKTYTLEIVELVKTAVANSAEITVDGEKDAAYGESYEIRRTYDRYAGASDNTASFSAAWNGDRLYLYVDVNDSTIIADDANSLGNDDRIAFYFDFANTRTENKYKEAEGAMGAAIKFSLVKNADGTYSAVVNAADDDQTTLNQAAFQASAQSAVKIKEDGSGYIMEVSIVPSDLYADLELESNKTIGFDIAISDAQRSGAGRAAVITWVDTEDRAWEYPNALGELTLGEAYVPSSDATLKSVTVDGVAAAINGTNITVEVAKADSHTVEAVTTDAKAKWEISSDGKSIIVTAEDGTQVTYTLTITEKTTDDNTTTNPTNGTLVKDGKTILFKDGKQVTGSVVVTVSGKTYVVIGGYVVTGKKQLVTVSGKSYIVDTNGVVQKNGKKQVIKITSKKSYIVDGNGVVIKGSKNKLVKVTAKKSYVVKKTGVIIKSTKNKLVKVGKKSYIVNKKGVVIKGSKNKLVKVGKKKYVVNKKGVVQKNKKKIKVGKKVYKTNKKGVAKKK